MEEVKTTLFFLTRVSWVDGEFCVLVDASLLVDTYFVAGFHFFFFLKKKKNEKGSKDATALFESMHPNSAVRDLLPKYKIGEIDVATIPKNQEQFTFDSPFHVEVKRRVFSYFKRRNLSRQDHWLQYVKLVVTMTGFLLSWYSVMMCGMW